MLKSEPANLIYDGLRSLELPPLVRPSVGPSDGPTEYLIRWGIKYYAYSSIAHVRTVLTGLMELAASGNQPTVLIVGRHLFEWAMHSCFMAESLKLSLEKSNWKEAWQFLIEVETGNSWIKKHGSKYANLEDIDDVPNSMRVNKFIKAYEREHSGSFVQDNYGYLSEHAHANAACFNSYRQLRGLEVSFIEAPRVHELPGVIHASIIDWTKFTYMILALGKEDVVRAKILAIIMQLAESAGGQHPRQDDTRPT
jgi:hypothetical protein